MKTLEHELKENIQALIRDLMELKKRDYSTFIDVINGMKRELGQEYFDLHFKELLD